MRASTSASQTKTVEQQVQRLDSGVPSSGVDMAQQHAESTKPVASDDSRRLDEVLEGEYEAIGRLSVEAKLASGSIAPDQLMGLAFSGGGIRSATFNLGVLQALAELKLLKEFDYLSTVSGGGYIGSWLSAWIARADQENRDRELQQKLDTGKEVPHTPGVDTVQEKLDPTRDPANEPDQIRFLRNYSNYLTPKTGLLSTDTLAGIATYLRNFILNLVILSAGLGAILLLPRVAAFLGVVLQDVPWFTLTVGVAALVVAVLFININLATQLPSSGFNRARQASQLPAKDPWYVKRTWVVVTIIGSLVVSALFLACWLAAPKHDLFDFFFKEESMRWHALAVLVAAPAVIAIIWEIALKVADVHKEITERPTWWWRLLGLVVGAAVGLASLVWLQSLFFAVDTNCIL
jgi:hypothetical protein